MDSLSPLSLFHLLPKDPLHLILSHLSIPQLLSFRSVCKLFNHSLSSPSFLQTLPSEPWLLLLLPLPETSPGNYPPLAGKLLSPYISPKPVVSSLSKILTLFSFDLCNPLTRKFTIFPSLGSAWCQHGTVVPSSKTVIVLTELAVLSLGSMGLWRNFSSGLCSKPRSPVLTRRRLVRGPRGRLLTVGSLKSSHAVNSQCSAVIILRLDLESLEWDEAAMMPLQIFESLEERVFFSGKGVKDLAMWECFGVGKGVWRWVENVPDNGDGLYRGLFIDARLDAVP
ncbi:hypothetical protein AMTRI_Chr11g94750 [Amborella trichopoda]